MKILFFLAISLTTMACNEQSKSQLDEAWNSSNDPRQMGFDYFNQTYKYKTNFETLPKKGELSQTPWSGDYWATYRGGITFRWPDATDWAEMTPEELEPQYSYDLITNPFEIVFAGKKKLSPAEKFDLYNGNYSFPLTKMERERTKIMSTVEGDESYNPDFEIPTWEGLCHAWAPATLQYKAPKNVMMMNPHGILVPFGASDIKALLTYNFHMVSDQVRTSFLGRRCEANVDHLIEKMNEGKITQEEFRTRYRKALKSSSCSDTNAGAFHLTLANQIALLDEGFVVDITRDSEVWNQGVYKYDTTVMREVNEAAPTAAEGTVRAVLVETAMYYVNEVNFSWDGSLGEDDDPEGIMYYYYWLELDADDNIIGGEWAKPSEFLEKEDLNIVNGDEKDDRPDFMWKMEKAPYHEMFKRLEKIYKKSTK